MTAIIKRTRQPPTTPPIMEVSFGFGVPEREESSSAAALVWVGADEDVEDGVESVADGCKVADELVLVLDPLGRCDWSWSLTHCVVPSWSEHE